jgi:hypothetical protein
MDDEQVSDALQAQPATPPMSDSLTSSNRRRRSCSLSHPVSISYRYLVVDFRNKRVRWEEGAPHTIYIVPTSLYTPSIMTDVWHGTCS